MNATVESTDLSATTPVRMRLAPGVLYGLFFLSGFPALLYQIVWQRALFAIYGVNIESVTIVVSAFMLGLGVGSLAGGLLSERPGMPLLLVFGAAELGIACFGAFSLKIFHYAALFTAGASPLKTGACAFLLLVFPTALMGSTLPILVTYLVGILRNVGRSVGILYFVNTLGSAAACFCAVFVTMPYLGESGTIHLAAAFNTAIGASMLLAYWLTRKTPVEADRTLAAAVRGNPSVTGEPRLFPLSVALLVSGLTGFVALGYEMLWYRVYSFAGRGHAPAFALLLGFYLTGIAFGSLVARFFCHNLDRQSLARHLRLLAGWVIFANVCAYLVIPIATSIATMPVGQHAWIQAPDWYWSYMYSLPLIAVATMLLGASFPLICHAAVKPTSSAGAHMGFLYLSNIIGSTLGSFVVGYILMDIWTTKDIAVFVALAGLGLGTAIFLCGKLSLRGAAVTVAVSVALGAVVVRSSGPLFDRMWERLQLNADYAPGYKFQHIVENKSGVITVTTDGIAYSGAVGDGVYNTEIINARPYSLSLWHPAPRKVLMIGLATGSWAQIIANHPQLEHFTVVEINAGYTGLLTQYPVKNILENPKVEIVIDDGRRWLFEHPEASFDVIVMNTIYHWRASSTNLLSAEFLQIIRQHLNPGGVLFYNATGSGEVQLTGATVFPFALMLGNCVAVSDTPFDLNWDRWKRILREYRRDGQPIFNLEKAEDRKSFQELMDYPIEYADSIRSRNRGKRLITDDNMGQEWPAIPLHIPRLLRYARN